MKPGKILLFANTDWYLYNFRRSLAEKLRETGWEVVLVSPPGVYGHRLQELGFRWIPFDFSIGGTNPFHEIGTIHRLVSLYRNERPSLAHHFTIKCVLYGSIAARIAGRIRVVNAVTGLGHIFTDQGWKARFLRPFVKKLYQFGLGANDGRIIFQNAEDQETFVRKGLVKPELTRLIRGSGVNCDRFKPSDSTDLPADRPIQLLFASRMIREKGVFELLEAFEMISADGLNARLLLAGDIYPGNPSSLTSDEIERIKRMNGIQFLGQVEDMQTLMSECDIVVLPSYAEGTPRVLIEAAAMGKPIVATNIGGCRGLVRDGENGFLVPVRSSIALADALVKLVCDPALRSKFGSAGRRIALAEFDERLVLERTLEVYEELFCESESR